MAVAQVEMEHEPQAAFEPWEVWEGALTSLGLLVLILGHIGLLTVGFADLAKPIWRPLVAPAAMVLAGLVALLTHRQPFRLRAAVFLLALLVGSLLFDATSSRPYVQYLYALCAFMAGATLGPLAAVIAASAGTASAFVFAGTAAEQAALAYTLGALWLSALVAAAAFHSSLAAIRVAEVQVAMAWKRARAADVRRGELVAAKKALSDMYALLERTNYELGVAREEAEEARRAKAHFAATISHELRTPLNLIAGFAELMYRFPETYGLDRWPPRLSADIHEIFQNSRHILGMIDDVLDLSRVEANRMPLRIEPTDLARLVREVCASAAALLRGKEVALRTKLPAALPELLVDQQRLSQVLLNLISNAARFTHRGYIEVAAEVSDGEVVVAVADTGTGMAAEDLVKVFEEFSQGSASAPSGGSGLGLAICRQLVHLHGGRIEAESTLGEGSTFRFTIPIPSSGKARSRLSYYAPDDWRQPLPANAPARTALIVAADETLAAPVSRALPGYRSVLASAIEEVVARVESEHPDGIVLVSQEGMPETITTDDIWHASGRADLPIVKYELPSKDFAQRELGVCGYLEKPVPRESLVAALQALEPSPKRVLVADDDPGFVALVRRILEAELDELAVGMAYSGTEAISRLREGGFDTVLLDLVMPDGGGIEVLEQVRADQQLSAIRFIVITGSDYSDKAATQRPLRLELLKQRASSRDEMGEYVSALLRLCPPDYSRPPTPIEQPGAVLATPAS
ncbi:MAG: ATP-binding protein [Anaerolineae bacterium]